MNKLAIILIIGLVIIFLLFFAPKLFLHGITLDSKTEECVQFGAMQNYDHPIQKALIVTTIPSKVIKNTITVDILTFGGLTYSQVSVTCKGTMPVQSEVIW